MLAILTALFVIFCSNLGYSIDYHDFNLNSNEQKGRGVQVYGFSGEFLSNLSL
jgi:hypothetical protein